MAATLNDPWDGIERRGFHRARWRLVLIGFLILFVGAFWQVHRETGIAAEARHAARQAEAAAQGAQAAARATNDESIRRCAATNDLRRGLTIGLDALAAENPQRKAATLKALKPILDETRPINCANPPARR